ncbi:MAG: DegT/DnrJ/EryC1/StrS family aminotransferase [Fibrobacterota bacterium]
MSTTRLAILGGKPIRKKPFPIAKNIGNEEIRAVTRVMKSGVLSKFIGAWHPDFYGGPQVKALEKGWAGYFGVKNAVSVNSATSGLYAALGAAGVGPGDDVIVSPYTMSASAVGALVYGAVPVFADIDPKTYCISAETIARVLTSRTKAIVVVDIFGHPADFDPIMKLARKHNLTVVEDAAQAPGAKYKGRFAGTLGHIGVFSLNYHKTIHCGEGGVVVSNDNELAERVRLIRNHAEAVVKAKKRADLGGLVGYNYRMTEIEAAIAGEQLKKLAMFTLPRLQAVDYYKERWKNIEWLAPAHVQPGCKHVYYVFALQYDAEKTGVSRARFAEAVRAEGVPLNEAYVEPLYLQPLYQKRSGRNGLNDPRYKGRLNYKKGLCPNCEDMYYRKLVHTTLLHQDLSLKDRKDVADAVEKVAENINRLK